MYVRNIKSIQVKGSKKHYYMAPPERHTCADEAPLGQNCHQCAQNSWRHNTSVIHIIYPQLQFKTSLLMSQHEILSTQRIWRKLMSARVTEMYDMWSKQRCIYNVNALRLILFEMMLLSKCRISFKSSPPLPSCTNTSSHVQRIVSWHQAKYVLSVDTRVEKSICTSQWRFSLRNERCLLKCIMQYLQILRFVDRYKISGCPGKVSSTAAPRQLFPW